MKPWQSPFDLSTNYTDYARNKGTHSEITANSKFLKNEETDSQEE